MQLAKNKIVILSSILITLIPILNIYKLSLISIGLGDIGLVIIIIGLFVINKGHIRSRGRLYFVAYYMFYFVLALISILIRNQSHITDFVQKWMRLSVYVCIYDIMAKSEFDFDIMRKWIIRFGMIVSIILITQVLLDMLLHVQITPYLNSSFLPLNSGSELDTASLIQAQRNMQKFGVWRASSVFPEPAYFAQYVLLPFALVIFSKGNLLQNKKRLFCSVIITFAIFLGQSANGIIISAIVWVIYIVGIFKGKIKRKHFMFAVVFIIMAAILLLKTNYLNNAWGRVATISVGGGATTGNQRLLQGFAVFSQLPQIAKWFGIGFGNLGAFLTENHITTAYLADIGNEYMSGFSTILVSGGIIGLILFLFIWLGMFFENNSPASRVLLVIISILLCTSGLFYNCLTVVYLVFIRCNTENNSKKKEEKNAKKNNVSIRNTPRSNKDVPAC